MSGVRGVSCWQLLTWLCIVICHSRAARGLPRYLHGRSPSAFIFVQSPAAAASSTSAAVAGRQSSVRLMSNKRRH